MSAFRRASGRPGPGARLSLHHTQPCVVGSASSLGLISSVGTQHPQKGVTSARLPSRHPQAGAKPLCLAPRPLTVSPQALASLLGTALLRPWCLSSPSARLRQEPWAEPSSCVLPPPGPRALAGPLGSRAESSPWTSPPVPGAEEELRGCGTRVRAGEAGSRLGLHGGADVPPATTASGA